jgi:hypothetical protein
MSMVFASLAKPNTVCSSGKVLAICGKVLATAAVTAGGSKTNWALASNVAYLTVQPGDR